MKRIITGTYYDFNTIRVPLIHDEYEYYEPILQRTLTLLLTWLYYEKSVLVFWVDLYAKEYEQTSHSLSGLLRKFVRQVKSSSGRDLGYIWAREMVPQQDGHHYHIAFVVSSRRATQPDGLIDHLEGLSSDFGLEVNVSNIYYRLIRCSEAYWEWALEFTFRRLSYLAKVPTKGLRPKTTRDFSSSQFAFPEDFSLNFNDPNGRRMIRSYEQASSCKKVLKWAMQGNSWSEHTNDCKECPDRDKSDFDNSPKISFYAPPHR